MNDKSCEGCPGKKGTGCAVHGYTYCIIACSDFLLDFMEETFTEGNRTLTNEEQIRYHLILKTKEYRKTSGLLK